MIKSFFLETTNFIEIQIVYEWLLELQLYNIHGYLQWIKNPKMATTAEQRY